MEWKPAGQPEHASLNQCQLIVANRCSGHPQQVVEIRFLCNVISLIKYTAFIDSLIVTLEQSRACASIYGTHVSPLGYADDIASASISERDIDNVLRIADRHSREWRYEFNAKKSAISVFGRTSKEYDNDAQHRRYLLGTERVKETNEYDHVGLKSCTRGKYSNRTLEKIKKGRKTLNAASGIGMKRGGLNMRACSFIFWSLIVPIVTFASELWVMGEEDIKLLDDFQIYCGRRVQRFTRNAPRESSYVGLGWMRLESFIAGKKLLFVRTIADKAAARGHVGTRTNQGSRFDCSVLYHLLAIPKI